MIVTGFKKDNELYLGTRSGQVITYTIGAGEKAKTYSQNDYKVVLDAKKVPGENAFYILTENALYKTSFENQEAEKIISTSGQRDFYIQPYPVRFFYRKLEACTVGSWFFDEPHSYSPYG